MLCTIIVACMSTDDPDSEPEAEDDDNGGNAAAVMNTCEYGANSQLVVDHTITSIDYASQQSCLVKGSTTSVTVTTVDQITRHCVVSNNGNSMAIVEDAVVCSYVVAIITQ